MSKAALYHGLGQALGSFGDNLQQQQVESARQKRQESLMALRRQWRQQDKAENRQFQMELMDRADQRWEDRYERQREDEIEDQSRVDPLDQRRMSLIDAQSEYYRRRAEAAGQGGSRGSSGTNLTADQRNLPIWLTRQAYEDAASTADQYFRFDKDEPPSVETLLEMHPQVAKAIDVDENTPLHEAKAKLQETIFRDIRDRYADDFQAPAGGLMDAGPGAQQGGGGLMDQGGGQELPPPEAIIPEAKAAVEQGADPIAIEQRLREAGYDEQQIQRVMGSL